MDKITICPLCYSSNYSILNEGELIAGQIRTYVCNNCGFEEVVFSQVNLDDIPKLKKIEELDVSKNIESKNNQINLVKLFIVLLFYFLIYTAYRFGLFDFIQSSHKHATDLFLKYGHIE